SFDGPPHFEFVEAVPNSPLQSTGVNHVAFWTDDLNQAVRDFETDGYKLVLTRMDENGTAPFRFAYMESSAGIIIELMDSAFQHFFEDYLGYRERGKSTWTDTAPR
ncbi:MAG: VOC family protein, partial [Pseudomonadota bacterium]